MATSDPLMTTTVTEPPKVLVIGDDAFSVGDNDSFDNFNFNPFF